jgi:azobenzene reductase
MMKILGVNGSMRTDALSARGLELVLQTSSEHGAKTRTLDLRRTQLPMYNPDDNEQETNDAVREATEAVAWADCLVLATPDYHGSMSGAMKNFLDYYYTEFAGKVFAYICASHEKGLTAMDQMRTAVRQCYGWSLPYGVAVHADTDFDAQGQIQNQNTARRLRMLARDLVVYGSVIRAQFERDLLDTAPDTFAARYRK